eukprot:4118990-Pleurochrysis_carterae.AAC.1
MPCFVSRLFYSVSGFFSFTFLEVGKRRDPLQKCFFYNGLPRQAISRRFRHGVADQSVLTN